MTRRLARFEGRLFAEGGCLFLVVAVDEAAELARVTCRVDGQRQVIDMPLAEVARRVTSGAGLILDNLNGPVSARRIHRRQDGWHFSSREGEMGPFDSEKTAGHELARYILSMQALNGTTSRKPLSPTVARRAGGTERRRQAEIRQAV